MGVFSVQMKLKNWQNRFLADDEKGEDIVCDALVDSGTAELALPIEIISRLKLEELDKVRVYTADGGEHEYRIFGIVEIEVEGRTCHVRVIELPHGAEPLLGAVPLEKRWIGIYPQCGKNWFRIHVLPKSHFCRYVEKTLGIIFFRK